MLVFLEKTHVLQKMMFESSLFLRETKNIFLAKSDSALVYALKVSKKRGKHV